MTFKQRPEGDDGVNNAGGWEKKSLGRKNRDNFFHKNSAATSRECDLNCVISHDRSPCGSLNPTSQKPLIDLINFHPPTEASRSLALSISSCLSAPSWLHRRHSQPLRILLSLTFCPSSMPRETPTWSFSTCTARLSQAVSTHTPCQSLPK